MILSLLLACLRESGGADSGVGGEGVAQLGNANNYGFSGDLTIPSFPLAAGEDVSLDWSDLSRDLQCHAIDPVADIDNVALMVFPYLNQAEVAVGLAHDTLKQVDLGVYLSWEPGDATRVSLSQLTFFGTEAKIHEEFDPDGATWLLLLSTGVQVGVGTRTLTFIAPDSSVSTTLAEVADACDVLEYTVDLDALAPVPMPSSAPWTVEWKELTVNGQGGPFEPTRVTEVILAHFATSDIAELEANFLDLESSADQLWRANHPGGTRVHLADLAADADGTPFSGFEPGGLWVFALRCATCSIPAPLALTRLVPG